jgi:hypothetical protein
MRLPGPLSDGCYFYGEAVTPADTPISGPGRIASVTLHLQDVVARDRDQKLSSHFGEAGAAIFAVKQV